MHSSRRANALIDQWVFQCPDTAPESVAVPHTWNALDSRRQGRYYRGLGTYRRTLPPLAANRRHYLLVEGASLAATVRVDGRELGHHRGAFTRFYVPLSASPHEQSLAIEVDNGFLDDIAPVAGDFNLPGGLVRPVRLIEAPLEGFIPTADGGEGVEWEGVTFFDRRAVIRWAATLETQPGRTLRVALEDAQGQRVAETTLPLETSGRTTGTLDLLDPIRWDGRANPYCYRLVFELMDAAEALDRLALTVGLRTIDRDPTTGGVLLNGRPLKLRGVCLHQEVGHQLWTAGPNEGAADIARLVELGANAVRLAHYPHRRETVEACDRAGLLAWVEIPLVDKLMADDRFYQTTATQLREMIAQYRHHPAIFAWGLFNEVYAGGSIEKDDVIFNLHREARQLDPDRHTICASHTGTPESLCNVTEFFAANLYFGWYRGEPEEMTENITKANGQGRERGLAISEYGAGGNPWQHEEPLRARPRTIDPWHPEEWQAQCHERQYEAIRRHPAVWGSFIWVLADFYSSARNEGGIPGTNDKGLLTADRGIAKDAWYFYKANWSTEPVLHLLSKRNFRPATPPEIIRCYSNRGEPIVTLNGEPLPLRAHRSEVIYEYQLPALECGEHRIEAHLPNLSLSDHRLFTLQYV